MFRRYLDRRRADQDRKTAAAALEMLIDELRLVALDVDQQIAALPNFVAVPDEVAELFDHGWLLVPVIHDAGLLSEEQRAAITRVNDVFDGMRDAGEDLWTVEQMRTHPLWKRSRDVAAEALMALGVPPGPPHLAHHTWVPAGD